MSVHSTHFKRPYDRTLTESNGKGKRQRSSSSSSHNTPPLKISPGSTVFRILCPVSKTGSVIGKGGNVISQIRRETGVKVRVDEPLLGSDERVIFIVGSDKKNGVNSEQKKENDEIDKETEEVDDAEDKKAVPVEELESEKGSSSSQKALLLVFERIVEGENPTSFVARLVVFSSQVSCLIGEGGNLLEQISSDTGAHIQILPRDELPSCASSSDELVQISGVVDAVRVALQSVSQQLVENPPQDNDLITLDSGGSSSVSSGHPFSRKESYPSPNYAIPVQGAPYAGGARDGEFINPSEDVVTFRLLCPADRVRGVIGKGGTIIKSLQHETGCEINVLTSGFDSVIVISGSAHLDDNISAPQDAVLRVHSKIIRVAPESTEKTVTARLLVSSNQIGCVLGKGGAVIAEMRKSTGAHIRVGKDQFPNRGLEDEEVQISGEVEAVQEALLQITARLRDRSIRDAFHLNSNFPDQGPPYPSYMGRREFSPPFGGFHPHDDRSPFMHNIHRPGFPPHVSERMPSSAQWGPQGLIEGGGPTGLRDYGGLPQRRTGGFAGGHQPIITNTTVEVVVPGSVVPIIYGEDGGCLRQIREISDANITITEPKFGAAETLIIISGTPEQTHAAQSLIQAFVISESEAP